VPRSGLRTSPYGVRPFFPRSHVAGHYVDRGPDRIFVDWQRVWDALVLGRRLQGGERSHRTRSGWLVKTPVQSRVPHVGVLMSELNARRLVAKAVRAIRSSLTGSPPAGTEPSLAGARSIPQLGRSSGTSKLPEKKKNRVGAHSCVNFGARAAHDGAAMRLRDLTGKRPGRRDRRRIVRELRGSTQGVFGVNRSRAGEKKSLTRSSRASLTWARASEREG